MELTELSTQLKTFDIVDSTPFPTVAGDFPDINSIENDNRRLTRLRRSQTVLKSDLWTVSKYLPQKMPKKVIDPEDEIRNIYLNNKVKVVHKNLETIFENPVSVKGDVMFLSKGKLKRSLHLCRRYRITKQKSKIRKIKIKQLGTKMKPCKLTDDEFKLKMSQIESFINSDDIQDVPIEDEATVCGNVDNSIPNDVTFDNISDMQTV